MLSGTPKIPTSTKMALRLQPKLIHIYLFTPFSVSKIYNIREVKTLRLGMMNPPNTSTNSIDTLPTVVAALEVLQKDAKNRNIEIDVQCTENNRSNCWKNLLKIWEKLVSNMHSTKLVGTINITALIHQKMRIRERLSRNYMMRSFFMWYSPLRFWAVPNDVVRQTYPN